MERPYDKALRKFYQASNVKYAKVGVDYQDRRDSTDNEEVTVYVKANTKATVNGRYTNSKSLVNQNQRDRNHNKTKIKPVQPKSCCSIQSCALCLCWTLFVIFIMIGLAFFVHQHPKRTHREHKGANSATTHIETKTIIPCDDFEVSKIWSSSFKAAATESAVRFIDANSDGIDDVILGFVNYSFTVETCKSKYDSQYPCSGGVVALDGKTGNVIWKYETGHEVFGINCNGDINSDGVPDCLLGGRNGVFDAIDGKKGKVLWKFSDKTLQNIGMNLYTGQFIRDLDGDGMMDVLQIHGGDMQAKPYSKTRLSGRIIFFSGKSGRILRWVETPDGKESYFSPLLYTLKNGTEMVIFGTGGETHGGALYVIQLMDLYYGKIHKAVAIYKDEHKGVMNPPVLIDLNKDGTVDMVNAIFNSTVVAIDGETFAILWQHHSPNTESYSIPAPGYYNDDDTIDFMIRSNTGPGFPLFYHSNITVLDGNDGRPIGRSFKTSIPQFTSPLTISMKGKGKDNFVVWSGDCLGHEGEGGRFGVLADQEVRFDTCDVRFGSQEFNRLSLVSDRFKLKGKTMYNSIGDQSKYTKEPKVNKDELKKQRPKHRKTRHGDGAGIKFAEGKEHVQRVVATGGLTKALNENAGRYGVTESIDMVFPVSWIKPLAVHGLTEDDLECIRKHTEDVSRGKTDSQHSNNTAKILSHGFYDPNSASVKQCLQNRLLKTGLKTTDKDNEHDHGTDNVGYMTVHRYNIKCLCKNMLSHQECTKILPMTQQEWGGYMGTLGNGFFNKRK